MREKNKIIIIGSSSSSIAVKSAKRYGNEEQGKNR